MDQVRQLLISEFHWQTMVYHCDSCLPEEACGLVGGRLIGEDARAEVVIPVVNALHSPVRYRMDPQAQINTFLDLERRGLDLVGIFHSHPSGPDLPSTTDVLEFQFPGVLMIILSPLGKISGWKLRAFTIDESQFSEIRIGYGNNTIEPHHRTPFSSAGLTN